jgi:positive phototaxis protein PixI
MSAVLSAETDHQFLSFSLPSDIQAMLPTANMTEILTLSASQLVPIANMPPEVLGVCNWRGEVLWLVDLGAIIGTEPMLRQVYRQPSVQVIVIHHQGCVLGLVVEQINEMLRYSTDDIHPVLATDSAKLSAHVEGCWLAEQGRAFWLLNCVSLIDAFYTDSA